MRPAIQLLGLAALVLSACVAGLHAEIPNGMVQIPAGIYRPINDPREVPIKTFKLDKLPVTNADFLDFVRANPAWRRSAVLRELADENYLKNWASDLELGPTIKTNQPAVSISWFAAKAYAQWRGKRLPTTAEWEFAANASTSRADGRRDVAFQKQIFHWYSTPSASELPIVGQSPANFWGAHDLHGLVWEWVADFDNASTGTNARNDSGPRDRFCGAGSVGAKDVGNFPAFMRSGFRSSLKANYCIHNLGFRCAQD